MIIDGLKQFTCPAIDSIVPIEQFQDVNKYYSERKKYFNKNIKNAKLEYNGKPVYLVFADDPDKDKCWNKFSKGGYTAHKNTNKIDSQRIPLLGLILYILKNNVDKCAPCKSYNYYSKPGRKPEITNLVLECETFIYRIVLEDKELFYVMLSAYKLN